MGNRTEVLDDLLSIDRETYAIVRPHRGMRDGWEVINGWNKDQLGEFDEGEHEEAIEYAQERASYSNSFNGVLAYYEPERDEDG
jgi:hypothetical protein